MTPSNQSFDKETSAVMEAFKEGAAPSETDNGNAQQLNAENTASNSRQLPNQDQPEKTNGTAKRISVKKTERQLEIQKPAADQQQPASVIKPEEIEKYFSEMLGVDSKTAKARIAKAAELEKLMEKSPYLTPKGKVLDELLSKNVSPDTALKYINTDKSTMSHKDIMALAMHVENPNVPMETVNDYLDQTYKLGKYADGGDEAPGKTRLEIDVQKHLKQFDQLKESLISGEQNRTTMAAQAKEVERVKGWEKPIQDLFKDFNKIEVKSPGGHILEYQVEMSNEERAEMHGELSDFILNNPNMAATEEGLATAKAIVQARYQVRHFDEIAVAFMNQGRSLSDLEWRDLIHNPSLPNGKGPVQQRGEGRDEALAHIIAQTEGGNPRKRS